MKSSRFSEEQIVGILKEQEARMSTALSVVPYGSSFLPTMPLTHEIHDTATVRPSSFHPPPCKHHDRL